MARDHTAVRGLLSPTERSRPAVRVVLAVNALILVAISLTAIFPLYWMVSGALKNPAETIAIPPSLVPSGLNWGSFAQAWSDLEYWRYFVNSASIAGGEVVLRVGCAVLAAYAISKLRVPLRRVVTGVILAVLMVPGMVFFVPQYIVVSDLPISGLSLLDTWWAIWLPHAAGVVNFILLLKFFDQIPDEVVEAAVVDGANSWRVLVRIVLPMSRSVLAVVVVITLIAGWKEFLWPLLVLQDKDLVPIEVALYGFTSFSSVPINVQFAAMTIATIPLVILFALCQKQIIRGVVLTGGKD